MAIAIEANVGGPAMHRCCCLKIVTCFEEVVLFRYWEFFPRKQLEGGKEWGVSVMKGVLQWKMHSTF